MAEGAKQTATTSDKDEKQAAATSEKGQGEQQKEKVKPGCCAYVFYYILLFFAFWFGASRFDVDGDGDFDPEDVEAFLEDHGFLHKNMKRPEPKKGQAAKAQAGGKDQGAKKESAPVAQAIGKDREAAAAAPKGEAAEKRKAEGAAQASNEQTAEGQENHHGWLDLDRDGDGQIGFNDLIETKCDGEAEEDIAIKNLRSGQIIPWFILLECVLVGGLWFIFAIVKISSEGGDFATVKAGLDTISDGSTDLWFFGYNCEDYRPQAWRWFTYQFTHVGFVHVLMNILLNLFLGIPLEGMHGRRRMFLMYNAGVFGGACCNMVIDQHTRVVGCSGGCYSLIGIHLADLIMNWGQKKFRLPTLFFIAFLIVADLAFNYAASTKDNVSHAAHLGGGIGGLLMGIEMVRNLKVMRGEKIVMAISVLFIIFWVVFSLAWLFSQTEGPRSIWEAMEGDPGWCWHRAMMDTSLVPLEWRCVRCGTQECIDRWIAFNTTESPKIGISALSPYSFSQCETLGWYDKGP